MNHWLGDRLAEFPAFEAAQVQWFNKLIRFTWWKISYNSPNPSAVQSPARPWQTLTPHRTISWLFKMRLIVGQAKRWSVWCEVWELDSCTSVHTCYKQCYALANLKQQILLILPRRGCWMMPDGSGVERALRALRAQCCVTFAPSGSSRSGWYLAMPFLGRVIATLWD